MTCHLECVVPDCGMPRKGPLVQLYNPKSYSDYYLCRSCQEAFEQDHSGSDQVSRDYHETRDDCFNFVVRWVQRRVPSAPGLVRMPEASGPEKTRETACQAPSCDCGALAAKTTHATWCSLVNTCRGFITKLPKE